MAVSLKHTFQSAKADGGDTSIVRPSDWNAEHTFTMATSRLLGRTTAGTGAAEEISVGTGLSLSAGSLSNSAPDQTVSLTGAGTTVVTGTYPNFTITSDDQYDGTVTSVGGTGTVNGITLTGTVTSSGNLTLGGALSGVDLTSQVTGTLPVANGGTGATSLTSGYLVKGNGTSAVSASVVYDNGTNVGIGTSSPAGKLDVTGSSGSVVVNATGDQIAYTYNGFNYLTASGATATLQIQASGASGKLTFATAGSERMRITAAGDVGIGTASPSSKLHVAGALTLATALAVANGGTNATATPTAGAVAYGTGTAYAFTSAGTAGQVLVSTGTTAPAFGGIDGGTF